MPVYLHFKDCLANGLLKLCQRSSGVKISLHLHIECHNQRDDYGLFIKPLAVNAHQECGEFRVEIRPI